ncbi:MAG: glycosyltransferase, partial [Desulfobacterales bacterium]|nr:glycosyltransferase [Desulfobacterales bacterium]
LGRDEKIILYVGRFTPLKGIDRLLKSMTFLRNNGKPRLVIIGGDGQDTPEFKKIQQTTWDFGINDIIHFAGRVEQKDLPFYYSAADVLVVSSYHESFGLVALEALACGTPVVATDVGGMKRIIDEGKTGVVIKNNAPYPFAREISRFLSMSCDKAASTESTRASVLRFGWSNIADAIIREYWTALKDHSDGFNPIPSHTIL